MATRTQFTREDLPALDRLLAQLAARDYDSIPRFMDFPAKHPNITLDQWAWVLSEIYKEARAKLLR